MAWARLLSCAPVVLAVQRAAAAVTVASADSVGHVRVMKVLLGFKRSQATLQSKSVAQRCRIEEDGSDIALQRAYRRAASHRIDLVNESARLRACGTMPGIRRQESRRVVRPT